MVLLIVGGAGTTALVPVGAYKAYQWWKARQAAKPAVVPATVTPVSPAVVPNKAVVEPAVRGADDPAPDGAVEWIKDITAAMGGSSAESMLAALLAGETRDQARSRRIRELEQVAKPKAAAVVPAKETEVKS